MSVNATSPPTLEDRFTQPPGWRWGHFTHEGRTLRFGCVFPEGQAPDAVVVCLPGLSEFSEKYFEVARDCLAHKLGFWVLDWYGQGLSGRYLKNSHKRHSHGFQNDIDDFHHFIVNHVRDAASQTGAHPPPLAMLAHSMGGNIGLHYLRTHPDVFACAAFSAPMCGLKIFSHIPQILALAITTLAGFFLSTRYVPGGKDWREHTRANPGNDPFSSDPVRGVVHNTWCLANPALQVGNVTYGWLKHAVSSCAALQKPGTLSCINIPCLLAAAGHEIFVDNKAVREIAARLPQAKLLELPNASHEILMEKDHSRQPFLDEFYTLIKESMNG